MKFKKILSTVLLTIILINAFCNPIFASTDTKQTIEKYVKYKDYSIYTECYNYNYKKKTAIILIHGLGACAQSADFLYNPENPYMTISYDNFCHGKSSMAVTDEINWENQIGAINAIIKAYNLKKVYLVGHSIGADISMMYGKMHPEKVKKIVLLDRAFYNYSDLEKYNFTREIVKTAGYNPQFLKMSKDMFSKYLDLLYDNDITKTWNIKRKVLLVAANPDGLKPDGVNPSIIDMVNDIKQNPQNYNITPEEAANLPNITLEDIDNISNVFRTQMDEFENSNYRFNVIRTKFIHNMQSDPNSRDVVRKYVLDFLSNY